MTYDDDDGDDVEGDDEDDGHIKLSGASREPGLGGAPQRSHQVDFYIRLCIAQCAIP